MKIRVDEAKCIGCGTCVSLCEDCFEMKGAISHPKNGGICKSEKCNLKEVAESCPVGAISIEEEKKTDASMPEEKQGSTQ